MASKTLKNLFFLGAMQGANYLVPIIAIPLLLDRIGLKPYGVIAFAQGIGSLLVAITDYGLNLTGTRDISQHDGDQGKLKYLISTILQTRLVLLVLGFLALFVLVSVIPKWQEEKIVILFTYSIVLAQGIMPQWYFEGVQKMHFLTALTFISRITYLACILIFIQVPGDYIYVNLFNGLSWLFCALVGLAVVFMKVGFPYISFQPSVIRSTLRNNFKIFISNLIAAGYRNGPILIAGSLFSPAVLGIYGVLDKAISLINTSGVIIFRSIFPSVSEKATPGNEASALAYGNRFLRKVILLTIPASILLALWGPNVLALASEKIIVDEVSVYFYFVAALPFPIYYNLRFTLPLLVFDLKNEYVLFNLVGFITLIGVGPIAAGLYHINGLLLALIVTEIAMLFYGSYLLKKTRTFSNDPHS